MIARLPIRDAETKRYPLLSLQECCYRLLK